MSRTIETREKKTVVFLCPGTFFSEEEHRDVVSWDPNEAAATALDIRARYNAAPYGFYFRRLEGFELDGKWQTVKELERSPMYYINGTVETFAEVEARATDKDSILLMNMRGNGMKKIVTTRNGYTHTAEFRDGDQIVRI